MYLRAQSHTLYIPLKTMFFASPLPSPDTLGLTRMTTPSLNHNSWYLFHFHPFAGFCPKSRDRRTDLSRIKYDDMICMRRHQRHNGFVWKWKHTTDLKNSAAWSDLALVLYNSQWKQSRSVVKVDIQSWQKCTFNSGPQSVLVGL